VRSIPVDDMSESRVKVALPRLGARGLSEDEMVLASRRSRGSGPFAVERLRGTSFGFATAVTGGRR
jgi:hypothetical protein